MLDISKEFEIIATKLDTEIQLLDLLKKAVLEMSAAYQSTAVAVIDEPVVTHKRTTSRGFKQPYKTRSTKKEQLKKIMIATAAFEASPEGLTAIELAKLMDLSPLLAKSLINSMLRRKIVVMHGYKKLEGRRKRSINFVLATAEDRSKARHPHSRRSPRNLRALASEIKDFVELKGGRATAAEIRNKFDLRPEQVSHACKYIPGLVNERHMSRNGMYSAYYYPVDRINGQVAVQLGLDHEKDKV